MRLQLAKVETDRFYVQHLLRHKQCIFDHRVFIAEGILVHRIVQRPGQFILTAPGAFRCGFNCGFDILEAVNLAGWMWLKQSSGPAQNLQDDRRQEETSREKILYPEAKKVLDRAENDRIGILSQHETTRAKAKILGELLWRALEIGELRASNLLNLCSRAEIVE